MIILHVVPRTVREKMLNINYYYGNILEIKQSGTIVLTINNVLGTIVDNRRVTIIFSVILKLKQCGNKVIVIIQQSKKSIYDGWYGIYHDT